jgi:hypothetical protein
MPLSEILRQLNSLGAPLPPKCTSGRWQRQALIRLLENTRYRDLWPYGESENRWQHKASYARQFKRDEPLSVEVFERLRLIDDPLWYNAQKKLAHEKRRQRRRNRRRGIRRRFSTVLSGLLVCHKHQNQVLHTGGAHGAYFRCPACKDHADQYLSRFVNRVLLLGLRPCFDPATSLTTWGPRSCFWIELPPSLMGKSTYRSSPTSDQQLGRLAMALNRTAHREAQRPPSLFGGVCSDVSNMLPAVGPSLPPTMVSLPAHVAHHLPPAMTDYVRQMTKLYRASVEQVWPILIEELLMPASDTRTGTALLDARLYDIAVHGESLGEYARLDQSLGRAIYNPIRKVPDVTNPTEDHVFRRMRQLMRPDVASGCTDDDLRAAARRPEFPLFASKIAKIHVFRRPPATDDQTVMTLSGHGQRLLMPLKRPTSPHADASRMIDCVANVG